MIARNPYNVPRTAMEVFEMLPEGTLCQVIDNIIYMLPALTFEHQDSFYLKNNKYELSPKIKSKIISKLLKKTFRF